MRDPQASALLGITMHDWSRVQKQPTCAKWFEEQYGTKTGIMWFVGAAKGELPNWDPNANPIEAWHKLLQFIPAVIARASFTNMLEVNIHEIGRDAALNLTAISWLFQPNYIPPEMLLAAVARTKNAKAFWASPDRSVYLILSRHFLAKYPRAELNEETVSTYRRCLKGVFPAGWSKEDAQELAGNTQVHCRTCEPPTIHCLLMALMLPCDTTKPPLIYAFHASSAHDASPVPRKMTPHYFRTTCILPAGCMHIVRRDMRYKGPSNPGLRCDCKRFVRIGLCSCCLAVAHHKNILDLNKLIDP
jgi:hypothetical protein